MRKPFPIAAEASILEANRYRARPGVGSTGKYQGSKFGCNFGRAAGSGQLASETGGECPPHSAHVEYRDSCKSDLTVDVCKGILGVEFHHSLPRPPACPKHLVDALERAVNALPASWLSPPHTGGVFATILDCERRLLRIEHS
jgi:hypothetical protein